MAEPILDAVSALPEGSPDPASARVSPRESRGTKATKGTKPVKKVKTPKRNDTSGMAVSSRAPKSVKKAPDAGSDPVRVIGNAGVRQRAERDLLDREAWLRAASDAIADGGFGQLRILVIAKKLGVTRGSFYWHFKDHADFVRAFLDRWLEFRRHRLAIWSSLVTEVDPQAALLHSLEINFDEGRNSHRNIRIELAIRDFATRDTYAAEVLKQSDTMRHAKSVELYTRLTGDPARARLLALTSYLVVAGADLMLQGPRRQDVDVRGIRDLVADVLIVQQAKHRPPSGGKP